MSYKLFLYNSSDDDDKVNSDLTIFTEACQAAYKASKPKIQRSQIERDRYGAHNRLVAAYFSEHPQYDEATFRRLGISSLMKCTSTIRQMAYGAVPDALDEYLQMGATTAHPFILLEAVAFNDLWIWHAFFGVPGMNNDVDVLRQSSIFNDLKSGRAPDVPFAANTSLIKGDIIY
ncbi:reverse transcriptase domain-containing protein [Tanacetum coccineum]